MKFIYLITDREDGTPLGAADTLDDAIWIADDYFGATPKYNHSSIRTDVTVYEYKYGGETLYGVITYKGNEGLQQANIWEIDFYPKTT